MCSKRVILETTETIASRLSCAGTRQRNIEFVRNLALVLSVAVLSAGPGRATDGESKAQGYLIQMNGRTLQVSRKNAKNLVRGARLAQRAALRNDSRDIRRLEERSEELEPEIVVLGEEVEELQSSIDKKVKELFEKDAKLRDTRLARVWKQFREGNTRIPDEIWQGTHKIVKGAAEAIVDVYGGPGTKFLLNVFNEIDDTKDENPFTRESAGIALDIVIDTTRQVKLPDGTVEGVPLFPVAKYDTKILNDIATGMFFIKDLEDGITDIARGYVKLDVEYAQETRKGLNELRNLVGQYRKVEAERKDLQEKQNWIEAKKLFIETGVQQELSTTERVMMENIEEWNDNAAEDGKLIDETYKQMDEGAAPNGPSEKTEDGVNEDVDPGPSQESDGENVGSDDGAGDEEKSLFEEALDDGPDELEWSFQHGNDLSGVRVIEYLPNGEERVIKREGEPHYSELEFLPDGTVRTVEAPEEPWDGGLEGQPRDDRDLLLDQLWEFEAEELDEETRGQLIREILDNMEGWEEVLKEGLARAENRLAQAEDATRQRSEEGERLERSLGQIDAQGLGNALSKFGGGLAQFEKANFQRGNDQKRDISQLERHFGGIPKFVLSGSSLPSRTVRKYRRPIVRDSHRIRRPRKKTLLRRGNPLPRSSRPTRNRPRATCALTSGCR